VEAATIARTSSPNRVAGGAVGMRSRASGVARLETAATPLSSIPDCF
jgi:hypothetical protein